ncbi:MAG: PHP domain-containing protein [Candidatus Kaelpia aquatica]|nr:PHP domain-containing protein [Candidatus Kaelpia aquatica]
MNKEADLHLHSIYSDGTFTPTEILKQAKDLSLSCISITDHDTVDGLDEAFKAANEIDIEFISGIELSSSYKGKEIHILGYFIDYREEWFLSKLKSFRDARKVRFMEMVKKLKDHGLAVDYEKILNDNPKAAIGRLHLGKALYEEGLVPSIAEVFAKYLGEGQSCYVAKEDLSISEVIEMIRSLGGLSILAHPFIIRNDSIVSELLDFGFDGIEASHLRHPKGIEKMYSKVAKERGILLSGGSDCHGEAKADMLIGKKRVPYDLVVKMKEYLDERR